jgi:predicted RNA binding protein YcfA (HicA-like mRNA interferase family)
MPRIVPVHWRELERVVLAVGFRFARQEGSHRSYTNVLPTVDRKLHPNVLQNCVVLTMFRSNGHGKVQIDGNTAPSGME